MAKTKFLLIRIADFIDDRILGHRYYWLCQKIGSSKWWPEDNWEEPDES